MLTAKVFENGRSQAVRLPAAYRFKENEVAINKIGEMVILLPKQNKWEGFIESFDLFTGDFMPNGREQESMQERDSL